MKEKADLLIFNASELLTIKGASKKPKTKKQMNELGIVSSGAVACFKGKIVAVGERDATTKSRAPINNVWREFKAQDRL